MIERRTKRSAERTEALQYLIESVADRSGAQALVLVDETGCVVAGTGMPTDVVGLARTTRDVAWRRASPAAVDEATRGHGHDIAARTVATPDGPLYFGALGDGMTRVGDAVRAVQRILAETLG
jgi:hypothetical protein